MARALYNIIAIEGKDILSTDSRVTNAVSSIKDIKSIPGNRYTAVTHCYGLGILTGMTDGTFSGESYMTRAQAAAIIIRMLRLIKGYVPEIADSSQTVDSTPQPAEQTTEENTEAIPGQTLANGKPVTDENIYELMEQLKAKWPNGTDYYTNFCSSNYAGDALTTICSFSTKTGYIVRGNNDKEWAENLPRSLTFTIEGVRFFLVHNKKEMPSDLSNVDVVIYGHSHKYACEERDGVLWLNPGSCGRRRFDQEITFAVITVADGHV